MQRVFCLFTFLDQRGGQDAQRLQPIRLRPLFIHRTPGIWSDPQILRICQMQRTKGSIPVTQKLQFQHMFPCRHIFKTQFVGRIDNIPLLSRQCRADGCTGIVGHLHRKGTALGLYRDPVDHIAAIVDKPLAGNIIKAQFFLPGDQTAVLSQQLDTEIAQQEIPLHIAALAEGQGYFQR